MFCWLDPIISHLRELHPECIIIIILCLYCNGYHYSLFLSDLQHHRPIQSYPTTYIYIHNIFILYNFIHISYIYIYIVYNTYVCGHIMIASIGDLSELLVSPLPLRIHHSRPLWLHVSIAFENAAQAAAAGHGEADRVALKKRDLSGKKSLWGLKASNMKDHERPGISGGFGLWGIPKVGWVEMGERFYRPFLLNHWGSELRLQPGVIGIGITYLGPSAWFGFGNAGVPGPTG